jgi:hypothetical protein
VWSRSTKAAGAVWIAGICLRVVLFGIGDLLGVRQDSSALLLGLAATLLARSALVARRARSRRPPAGGNGPTYGDGVSRARREERV